MLSKTTFVQNFIAVSLEALPFLAFGFFIAGLLKAFVPDKWVIKVLGKESSSLMSPVKGALLGAPIPLCSCSVIPVATGLKQQGANKGALSAFLVSAPETGADSLSVSYALLGPVMMVARLCSALVTAVVTAWTVMAITGKDMPTKTPIKSQKSCCATQKAEPMPGQSGGQKKGQSPHIWYTFIAGQRHAFTTLLDDSFKYMMFALVLTALMKTYIPTDFFASYSYGIWAMILTVLISFPMYICASASTPIAAGLILSGVSPGVALVFMLAGPASNVATVVIARRLMGTVSAVIYVLAISIVSIIAGLLLNTIVDTQGWDIVAQASYGSVIPSQIAVALSVFVVLCTIKPLRPYLGLQAITD